MSLILRPYKNFFILLQTDSRSLQYGSYVYADPKNNSDLIAEVVDINHLNERATLKIIKDFVFKDYRWPKDILVGIPYSQPLVNYYEKFPYCYLSAVLYCSKVYVCSCKLVNNLSPEECPQAWDLIT